MRLGSGCVHVCRLAAAVPILPLAGQLPYDVGVAIKNLKKKFYFGGVPVAVQWLTNPTRNYEVAGSVSALAQWVKDPALP